MGKKLTKELAVAHDLVLAIGGLVDHVVLDTTRRLDAAQSATQVHQDGEGTLQGLREGE